MPDELHPTEMETAIDSKVARLIELPLREQRSRSFKANYVRIHKLGRGAEGEVTAMRHKPSGTVYAVKKIKQRYHSEIPTAHNEVRILSLLLSVGEGGGQKTICNPAAEAWYPETPCHGFQMLVMEFCELGSLYDYLLDDCYNEHCDTWRTPAEGWLRHIYAQLLAGIAFIHHGYGTTAFDGPNKPPKGRYPVIHRDLKPENILCCPAPPSAHPSLVTVKLSDFGGAATVKPTPRIAKDDEHMYFFTDGFYAPEFLKNKMEPWMANQSNDVFAIGATVHFCIWGAKPYVRDNNGWLQFKRRDCIKKRHRGGKTFTADFDTAIANAVTYSRHRKDALTILEKLKRTEAAHLREYLDWLRNVEEPRLELERQRYEEQERREALAREKAFKQQLRLQCFDPLCRYIEYDGFLPHTHECELGNCLMAKTPAHGHWLLLLEGTWADPRTYLPRQLNKVPQEQINETMRCIELSAEALLQGRLSETRLLLESLTVVDEVEDVVMTDPEQPISTW